MDNNKIYVGDVSTVLRQFEDDFFDITVTSPPYNKQKAAGGLVKKVEYGENTDNMPEDQYQHQQIMVLNQLWRVTKPGGHIFYNHKLRWQDGKMIHPLEWLSKTMWDIRQELIWDRGIAGNLRGWRFWQIEERIYWMQKGLVLGDELASRHAKMTSVWRMRPEGGHKEHPAPFPIELPVRCIYSIADERRGLNVLDPYCGIGTTLVAASAMDHNYVGIEVNDTYAELAKQRLQSTSDDAERVCVEQNLHNVEMSYQERKKLKLSKSQ